MKFLSLATFFRCWLTFVFGVLGTLLTALAPAYGQEVIPDHYKEPGLSSNRDYVNQSLNEFIDPYSGALSHHYVDLYVPGNGKFDLKVIRSYNSAAVDTGNPGLYKGLAGVGWTVHFGRVLKRTDNICANVNAMSVADNPVLELPDGSRQLLVFTGSSSPQMLTNARWRADCRADGLGLVVVSPEGMRYDMTQKLNVGTAVNPVFAWFTSRITDSNGNYADIRYAAVASPQIASVSTNDGRVVTFNYFDSGLETRRISSISFGGRTFSYSYTALAGWSGVYMLTAVTRPGGTSWKYNYNGNLNLSPGSYLMNSFAYPEGGAISYQYAFVYFDSQANPNSRANVVAKKTASGRDWTFAYAPGRAGVLDKTTVNTPSGIVTYEHIGPNYTSSGTVWMTGLLMSKTVGGIQTETYTWEKMKISSENFFRPGAFVTKVDSGATNAPLLKSLTINRQGAVYSTTYAAWDGYGNPTSVVESGPNGGARSTNLSYYINVGKWIINRIQNETFTGSSTARTFDANGNLLSINNDGVVTSFTYDGQGNISSVTYPRALVHSFANYKRGIAQAESQPEGVSISRVVDDSGNVISQTNGDGRVTTYGYDGLNRLTSITYPVGSAVSVAYGTASKTSTRGGLVESINYDGFGRPVSVTLGGITKTFAYDALGRKTFESNPGSTDGKAFAYDILNRVVRVTNPDATFSTIAYGASTVTETDERGRATTYSYRSYGDPKNQWLMSIQAADPAANIAISRNSKDLVTGITQAGITRTFGYNGNYYLTTVSNPETGVTTYGRDAAGNMTTRTVGSSGTTTYTYDGQNRLATVTYPGATPPVTNTYSKTHKLLSANSANGNRAFTYDANGNLTSESLVLDGLTFTASYAYNGQDQLMSVTYPRSGATVNYSPDVLGRPTQVSGYVNAVTYWPSGQIRQINYANGTTSAYNQNSRLWPSSFSTVKAGGATYLNTAYTYDGVGNLTGINDVTDSSYNRTMGYDSLNRLTNISGPWGAGTISYSGAGNITSQVLGASTLTYTYDTANRLSSLSGVRSGALGYDAYGNIVTGMGNAYAYDGVPNLRCVNCSNSATKTEFGYDGTNQRSFVISAGVKTYEMYGSSGNLLIEFTPSQSNRLVEYIYLGGKRIAQRVSP